MFNVQRVVHWPGQKLPLDEFVEQYNQLFQEGTDLFNKFDPCRIHDHTCIRGQLEEGSSFCCDGCQYLTDHGCTTNSMWCRLWICRSINGPLDFILRLTPLRKGAHHLCCGRGGRYGLDNYVKSFYSEEKYEAWKTTEIKSNSISAQFVK